MDCTSTLLRVATGQKSPHFSAQNVDFIHVAKYNEKFPKIAENDFFLVNDSQKRLFFFLKSGKLACFLLVFKFPRFFHRNHRKPRFCHVGYKNWRLVFSQPWKIENPCFFFDSYFKFPRFFHRNHRNPRFSTFCGKIHVSGNPDLAAVQHSSSLAHSFRPHLTHRPELASPMKAASG